MRNEQEVQAEFDLLQKEMNECWHKDTDLEIPGPWLELRNLAWALAWVLEKKVDGKPCLSPFKMYEDEVKPYSSSDK